MFRRIFIISGMSWIFSNNILIASSSQLKVTEIVVKKHKRRMYLFSGNEIIKSYKVDLGFAPEGHKKFEGDGKTPEGTYKIDRKNRNSKYHLSIGISYPNVKDQHFAKLKEKTLSVLMESEFKGRAEDFTEITTSTPLKTGEIYALKVDSYSADSLIARD